MAGFDAHEIERFAADLGRASDDTTKLASQIIRRGGAQLEAEAKRLAPVRTGNLKNSIGADQEGPLTVVVGPTANYAPFVEFGTRRMAPRAFLGPAFDRTVPDVIGALEQAVGGILDG